ncbi:DUF4442 domain-containing protein [soil metagenome]
MPDSPAAQAFRRIIKSPLRFRLFLLRHLPMAYLAGLRVRSLGPQEAVVSIRLTYLTKNPFRSLYFACLAMAAELSTGLLAMMGVYQAQPSISLLLTKVEGTFRKKAVGKIAFTCSDGEAIEAAIQEAKATGAGTTVTATSTGTDEAGDQVAEFRITWAFKARSGNK